MGTSRHRTPAGARLRFAGPLRRPGRISDKKDASLAARPRQAAGTGHETFTYEAFGMVVKLFQERLALGVHGLVPNGEFTKIRAFYPDEREQYFSNSLHPELYSDRLTPVSLAVRHRPARADRHRSLWIPGFFPDSPARHRRTYLLCANCRSSDRVDPPIERGSNG